MVEKENCGSAMEAQTGIVMKDLEHERATMASSSLLSKAVSSKSTDAATVISREIESQMMCYMLNKKYVLVPYYLHIV